MGESRQNGFTTGLEMKNEITRPQATGRLQQVIQEPQTARKHIHQGNTNLGSPMNEYASEVGEFWF